MQRIMDFSRAEQSMQAVLASKRAVTAVVLLIAASAIWLLYVDVGPYLQAEQDADATAPAAETAGPGDADVSILSRRIAAQHLFGAAATGDNTREKPVAAPDTRLSLVLNGTVASNDEGHSYALISNPSGQTQSFSKGERVFGMAVLEEIYTDRVILSRNGRNESLRLPEKRIGGGEQDARQDAGGMSPAELRALQRKSRR